MKPDPKNPRTCLYRLFRPEFVVQYSKPLCSDGFCKWNRADDADLIEATEYFENTYVPEVAKKVDAEYVVI